MLCKMTYPDPLYIKKIYDCNHNQEKNLTSPPFILDYCRSDQIFPVLMHPNLLQNLPVNIINYLMQRCPTAYLRSPHF